MKGYKQLRKEYVQSLDPVLTPSEKREALEGWKDGYKAAYEVKDKEYPYLDKTDPFKVTSGDFNPRDALKARGRIHPKVTPYDLDPQYRDKGEKEHAEGDLKGVKQYPVLIKDEPKYPEPSFDHIKSVRLRRSAEILELKIGYDHKSNAHVLYSPLKYNERWDQQSQAIWLRVIGMSPKRIGIRLKIKYDTIKNWMRVLKGQPLIGATEYDWAIRQVEGSAELMSKRSSIEAKGRTPEAIP